MTEIEKMFENAGIKKQYCGWLDMGDLDCQMQYIRCNSITEWKDAVFSSRFGESEEEPEYNYPDFTAKKQLELIKWLAKLDGHFEISCTYNKEAYSFSFYFNRKTEKHKNPTFPYSIMNGSDFIELLAKQVNELWQSLTNQEKEEIRNILNA